jgi:2-dehydro-3-deoxyphosphogluconate aldolase/(4S)-4-hydroxy-2-oxoglutarate aldolase
VDEALEIIRQSRVIAVLRAAEPTFLDVVADVLASCGVRAIEIALTTPGALQAIEAYAHAAPASTVLGAGTVLSPADARKAIDAGARYLVTPTFLPEVVTAGRKRSIPVLAGAFTPTEVLAAHTAGASAVKLFPAALGGPSYVRLVRDPLPDVPLIPTGGIGIDDIEEYLAAGAVAVGTGGQLTGDALRGGNLAALAERATRLVAAVARASCIP